MDAFAACFLCAVLPAQLFHVSLQAREEALRRWEEVLKSRADETAKETQNLDEDRLSHGQACQERSNALKREEAQLAERASVLQERELAISVRQKGLQDAEQTLDAARREQEVWRERLAKAEKDVEGQRSDIAQRKVIADLSAGLLFIFDGSKTFCGLFGEVSPTIQFPRGCKSRGEDVLCSRSFSGAEHLP